MTDKPESHEYHLHYIGHGPRGVYTPARFVAEATKIGVNRSIPARWLRGMQWGESVLLGTWDGKKDREGHRKDPNDREGTASIFAYFILTGLNLSASKDCKKMILKNLHIVETVERETTRVERACGSYEIGATSYVKETIAEIVAIGEEIAEKRGEKIKWFIGGPIRALKEYVTLDPAKFTRTILNVSTQVSLTEGLDGDGEVRTGGVSFVFSYELRKYVRRADRERLAEIYKDVIP